MTGAAHKNKNSHVVLRGETPGAKEREDDNWYVKELTSCDQYSRNKEFTSQYNTVKPSYQSQPR